MNQEQIKEAITKYNEFLNDLEAYKQQADYNIICDQFFIATGQPYKHLKYMCEKILNDEIQGEKAHRWLGFIQGVFWILGDYSLNELKSDNRQR